MSVHRARPAHRAGRSCCSTTWLQAWYLPTGHLLVRAPRRRGAGGAVRPRATGDHRRGRAGARRGAGVGHGGVALLAWSAAGYAGLRAGHRRRDRERGGAGEPRRGASRRSTPRGTGTSTRSRCPPTGAASRWASAGERRLEHLDQAAGPRDRSPGSRSAGRTAGRPGRPTAGRWPSSGTRGNTSSVYRAAGRRQRRRTGCWPGSTGRSRRSTGRPTGAGSCSAPTTAPAGAGDSSASAPAATRTPVPLVASQFTELHPAAVARRPLARLHLERDRARTRSTCGPSRRRRRALAGLQRRRRRAALVATTGGSCSTLDGDAAAWSPRRSRPAPAFEVTGAAAAVRRLRVRDANRSTHRTTCCPAAGLRSSWSRPIRSDGRRHSPVVVSRTGSGS